MLEPTVKELVDHLHHHFPPNQNYSKEQLESARAMPAPIAHYIHRQTIQRVAQHVHGISDDPWIDSTEPAVRQELGELEQALEKAARVPADQWSDVIADASKKIVLYLVDPVTELADFVFRERSSLPVAEVRRRMTHFSPYSYLHSVFTAYADRKSLDTIDHDRFKEVLSRIDRQMVADYTADKWERLFQPLYEVLGVLSPSTEEPRVRVELVRRLAANKQFEALLRQLNQIDSSRLSLADIRRLIGAALSQSSPEPASRGQIEPQQPREREPDQPQPRWKQFQQGKPVRSSRPAPSPKPRSQSQQSSTNKPGKPLWQQFQQPDKSTDKSTSSQPSGGSSSGSPSTPSAPPTPDLTSQNSSSSLDALERKVVGVIPGDQRERFIRRLFSGSQQEYADILAELQEVNSWERASSLIAKKVFLPHQVNIYSEPAVTFTDLVEARFQQTSVRR